MPNAELITFNISHRGLRAPKRRKHGKDRQTAAGPHGWNVPGFRETKDKGVDALEAEIRFRNATGLQLDVNMEAAEAAIAKVAERIYMTFSTVTMWTINQLWHHGKKGLHDFENTFNSYVEDLNAVDYYGERYVRFGDMAAELNEKYDLDLSMERITEVDEINDHTDIRIRRVTVPSIYELLKRNKFDDAAEFIKEFWGEEFFKYEN